MTRTALFLKHRPLAATIARDFHFPGSSDDDVKQEAEIGLWEASGIWDREQSSFKTFASVVISRHLTDCLKAATRMKQQALSGSLRVVVLEEDEMEATDLYPDTRGEPSRRLEGLETLRAMAVTPMSPIERQVLLAFLHGSTHEELCAETHRSYKSIDCALQRAKRKVLAA